MALYFASVLLKFEKVVQAEQIKERKEYEHPSGKYDGVENVGAPYEDDRIMPRWFGRKFSARTTKELQALKELEVKKEEAHPSTPEERALERQREREEDDPWCVRKDTRFP